MLLLDVFRPDDFAARRIETEEIAPPAQRVDAITVDGGRAGGAALEELVAEFGGVGMLPDLLAGIGVEAEKRVCVIREAEREDTALGDDERREPDARLRFP